MAANMDIDDLPGSSHDDGDEVVYEIDLYAGGPGALGRPSTQGFVLQFPLRPLSRPYERPSHVKFKSKVKRMHWEIPLDTNSEHYNEYAPEETRINSYTLSSSRVDPGMQGLAVAMRKDDKLFLIPVTEVLQLRPSPTHLDKEANGNNGTEGAKAANIRGQKVNKSSGTFVAPEIKEEDTKATELMPITVQVKKHETEQQTEARLRSYAFHAQQEENDVWIDLKYRAAKSKEAVAVLENIPKLVASAEATAATQGSGPSYMVYAQSPASYLDAISPGSTTMMDEIKLESYEMTGNGQNGNIEDGLGQPPGENAQTGTGHLPPDALAALPSTLTAFFANTPVLSLENIRSLLLNSPSNAVLNRAGQIASDAALHKAILEAGDYICIRSSYTLRRLNNDTIDPMRAVVLELLQEKEQIKRQDVVSLLQLRGVDFSEALYHKVIKELCYSKGSVWSLRNGSEKS